MGSSLIKRESAINRRIRFKLVFQPVESDRTGSVLCSSDKENDIQGKSLSPPFKHLLIVLETYEGPMTDPQS